MVRMRLTRLTHRWVQAEIGDELLGIFEPGDWPYSGSQSECHHHVDPGNGHQALDVVTGQGSLGQFPFNDRQVIAQAVILAQVPLDCLLLVHGKLLPGKPRSSPNAKQVGMRTLWDKVGMQGGLRCLQPDALLHNLVAPGYLAPQSQGLRIRDPNFRWTCPGEVESSL